MANTKKESFDDILFKREFKSWLYEKMGYISNSFGFNSVVKIVRQFHKENSDKQLEGIRKDSDMQDLREKVLNEKIKLLEKQIQKLKNNNNG